MNLSFAEGRAYSQNANSWRNYSVCISISSTSIDEVPQLINVLKRSDISADGQATMEAFNGRN